MCLGGSQPKAPINKPDYNPSQIDQNMTLKIKGPDGTQTLQKQPKDTKGGSEDTSKGPLAATPRTLQR